MRHPLRDGRSWLLMSSFLHVSFSFLFCIAYSFTFNSMAHFPHPFFNNISKLYFYATNEAVVPFYLHVRRIGGGDGGEGVGGQNEKRPSFIDIENRKSSGCMCGSCCVSGMIIWPWNKEGLVSIGSGSWLKCLLPAPRSSTAFPSSSPPLCATLTCLPLC